ncbi:hypothetical protein MJ563_01380 [Klebsiella pneumoniae]|nr:hypothetical protein MJ563_01380 [Klebsiella pneumoniae]
MMMAGNLHLSSLGFIFASWEPVLGPFGFFPTLLCRLGRYHVFNMVDGIDGLLGGLSSVSLRRPGLSFGLMVSTAWRCGCFRDDRRHSTHILLNLWRHSGRYKVFMGDAGSTMIGFTIIDPAGNHAR